MCIKLGRLKLAQQIVLIVLAVLLCWQFAARLGKWNYHPALPITKTVDVLLEFGEKVGVWSARVFGAILPECWAQIKYWTGWIWDHLEVWVCNLIRWIQEVLVELWQWIEWFVEKYVWAIVKELLYAAWELFAPLVRLAFVLPIWFLIGYFTELYLLANYYGGVALYSYYWWLMLVSTPVCMLLVERLVFYLARWQQWTFYLAFRDRYTVTWKSIRTLAVKVIDQLSAAPAVAPLNHNGSPVNKPLTQLFGVAPLGGDGTLLGALPQFAATPLTQDNQQQQQHNHAKRIRRSQAGGDVVY